MARVEYERPIDELQPFEEYPSNPEHIKEIKHSKWDSE